MVRVGPYEFDHDEVSEGGNRYIAWTDLPSGASSHRATNEILWADSGLIVEWLFELGRDEPPTGVIISEVGQAIGPAVIPLPDESATIVVPQAEYRAPNAPRRRATQDAN